jgi:Protein of unknown function (DUF1616)
MHRYRDVALTLAYVIVAGVFLLLGVRTPLNAPLFAPLVLFVPGYTLVTALEPRDRETDWPKRLVLSVSLSMALIALSGLVLNIVGLDRTVWGVFLVAVSLGGGAATIARRAADRTGYARRRVFARAGHRAVVASALFTTLLMAAAVLLTETTAHHSYLQPVVAVSALPSGSGGHRTEVLSVSNLSRDRQFFTLSLQTRRVHRLERISVGPNQTWSTAASASPGRLTVTAGSSTMRSAFIRQVSWDD